MAQTFAQLDDLGRRRSVTEKPAALIVEQSPALPHQVVIKDIDEAVVVVILSIRAHR